MADEALASFQHLLEVVPGWISDLESILTTSTQQQSCLSTTTTTTTNPSITEAPSHKSQDTANKPPHRTTPDFLRFLQRKRRTSPTTTACSAESRTDSYRSRQAHICYDGNTQRSFENIVRAIGTSRNSIRKAKLSMKIDSLGRSDSVSSSSSSGSGAETSIYGEETIKGLGTFTFRTTTTFSRQAHDADTTAFDNVDGCLEKAQMLCEKAAHQILRDGDCSKEVTKAKEHFQEAIVTINAETPSLTKKAAKALRHRLVEDEKPEHEQDLVENHIIPSDGVLEVDLDEHIDDDEEDDETDSGDFNLMTMRLPPHLSKYTASPGRYTAPHIPVRGLVS